MLVLILEVATVYLLENTPRFYVEKRQLLNDPEFLHGQLHWQQQGIGTVQYNGSAVSLFSERSTVHSVYQNIPVAHGGHYRVSFEAATKGIRGAGAAEIVVVTRSRLGDATGHYKRIFSVSGSKPLAPYSSTLNLVRGVGSIDLMFRLVSVSGQFTVLSPVISLLQELPSYKRVKTAILIVWGLVFGAIGFVAIRVFSPVHASAIGCTVLLAMIGVTLPDGLVPKELLKAGENILASVIATMGSSVGVEISGIGHFSIFLLLGAVLGFNMRKIGVVYSLSILSAFGVLTEIMQMLVIGRTTSIDDFLVDVIAGAIGIAVGFAIFFFFGSSSEQHRLPGMYTNHRAKE